MNPHHPDRLGHLPPITDEDAVRLGRKVYDLFMTYRPLTPEKRDALEVLTGVPPVVWEILEADYQRHLDSQ